MKCVPYCLKNRQKQSIWGQVEKGTLSAVWRYHVMSYIGIGQETLISIYAHKWSIAFYKLILIKSYQFNCLYDEITYGVWQKLGKKRRKYVQISIYPDELSTAFFKLILINITWGEDNCMEKSYLIIITWGEDNCMKKSYKLLKSGKIRRKYLISIYTWVKYSSQCTQMKTTANHEYCMDKSHTQPDRNRARNVQNTSTSYYAKILMTPTVTWENQAETPRAECYWNLARNVEYMSKYLFTNMSEVHHLIKPF